MPLGPPIPQPILIALVVALMIFSYFAFGFFVCWAWDRIFGVPVQDMSDAEIGNRAIKWADGRASFGVLPTFLLDE